VHDEVSITGFDPPPPVDFFLSPTLQWKEEAIKFIEILSGKSISPVLEANYIIPCDDLLPHFCDSIRGDGNCLFRALSKEVTGSQKHHLAVRLAIVNFIQCYEHPPELSHYLVKEFEKQVHLTSPAQCLAACKDYVKNAAMSKLGVC